MTHTHSPAEWAESLSLGVSAAALVGLVLAFADADPGYFDPRRLLDTDTAARLIVAFFNAKTAMREFVLDAAALALLLTTSPQKGATS